ncbi:phosphonate metabolism transcriptional regulator PhnF [Bosea sp. TWI1241]|uniref:phosphonate metabolism transcriptional regulator PhnF n=1 Tax=Bosea sp. TWI1241 TaxID=3148904 RepID=UPI00320B9632
MTGELEAAPADGTVWRRIADEIAGAIDRGDYAAGDLLPASVALAERYGVHRHTVRQAFRHLAEQGLVSVSRGRGTQVIARRFPYRLGRRVSLRTNFGAAGIPASGQVIDAAVVAGDAAACERLSLPTGSPLWRIRSVSLADGLPVGTGVHQLCATRFPGFDRLLAEAGASLTAALKACGIPDYVRLQTRLGARLADAREADLLKIAPGAAVLTSDAVDALPDLSPIHLIDSVFAGERMEMLVEPFAE